MGVFVGGARAVAARGSAAPRPWHWKIRIAIAMISAAALWFVPGTAWAIGGSNGKVSSGTGANCPAPVPPPTNATEVTLPFSGLINPAGVAVSSAGDVFVADSDNNRVVDLPSGSGSQVTKPFTGLFSPVGIAVDSSGGLFVTDTNNSRVVDQPRMTTGDTPLPFNGLRTPVGIAVDGAGDVFVTDTFSRQVLELPAGSTSQMTLPFTGLGDPWGVAVDSAGDVYTTDSLNNEVLELPAGSSTQMTLPFTGLRNPTGLAVDAGGDVYVADTGNNRVLELPNGSTSQVTLPFSGLNGPVGVALDSARDVFIVDSADNRVLELSPPFFAFHPVPTINIGPLAVKAGLPVGERYLLSITGTNFEQWSKVQLTPPGGTTGTFFPCPINLTQLGVAIPAASIATPGTRELTVVNLAPGGSSNVQPLFVTPANVAVSSESVSSTGAATTGGTGQGSAGSVSLGGSGGSGTLAAALYNANPGTAPSFNATGAYFDAWVAPGSTYSSVVITDCDLQGGSQVYWHDPATSSWVLASNQSYDATTQCVTVTVDATTVPSLTQLGGTIFAVADPHPGLAVPAASGMLQTLSQGSANCNLLLNAGATITAAGGVAVNGKSASAVCLNGSSTLSSSSTTVQGGVQGNVDIFSSIFGPLQTQQPAAADLLAGLPAPTAPSATCPGAACPGGSNLNKGQTYRLLPGTYTQAVNVNGGATACVAPGVYVLRASWTLNSSGLRPYGSAGCPALPGGTTDPGVLLYFAQGNVVLNGSADLSQLQAMQSGPYAGLLYWQAGTASTSLNGSSVFAGGAWYEPNGTLTLNASAHLTAPYVAASTITANGGTSLTVTSS